MTPKTLFYNIVLLLSHISAQWQTYLISSMVVADKEPESYYNIKIALGLSKVQFGIVTGTAFTLTNGIAGLCFGHLADIYSRKMLWIAACFAWTGCTFAISYCSDFTGILLARIGFSILMGTCVPISVSLLSDLTLPSERGTAQAIFAAGVYMGVGLSAFAVIFDDALGWRNAIRLVCGICWLISIPMFFVPEPERNLKNREEDQKILAEKAGISSIEHDPLMQQRDNSARQSLQTPDNVSPIRVDEQIYHNERGSVVQVEASGANVWEKTKILAKNSCFMYLMVASFFRFWGGYSLGFLWGPFFESRYPDYTTQYGIMGFIIPTCAGLPASIVGGYISDKFEKKYTNIKGIIAGGGALAATPFIVIAYGWQPGFWISIMSYFVAYFLAEMWYGPSHAQINNMFPSEFQGFAVAVFNLAGSLAGSIATLFLSYLSGTLTKGKTDFNAAQIDGYILCGGVLFSYLLCGPFFLLSGRKYAKMLEEKEAAMRLSVLQPQDTKEIEYM